jgi:hypothetical protein
MKELTSSSWLDLSPPLPPRSIAHGAFRRLAGSLQRAARAPSEHRTARIDAALEQALATPRVAPQHIQPLKAASLVLADLARQGWSIKVAPGGARVRSPEPTTDRDVEKVRVRQQESVKRDQQLRTLPVARFIQSMERRRVYEGEAVSIFSLMRNGKQLADGLKEARLKVGDSRIAAIQALIDPYLQFVTPTDRCELTGLRLQDIWRYFRHTWTTPYESTPGRSMMFLVRDRAAPFHPVIGIGALCSPIVQLGQRDRWLEWDADTFVEKLRSQPTTRVGRSRGFGLP